MSFILRDFGIKRRIKMQNWKIRRMSVMRINQWLSAIGKLLKHYEGKVRIYSCPLCYVPKKGGYGTDKCWLCLWEIIEGKECKDLAKELYGSYYVSRCRSNLRFKKWRIIRLGQLRNWKKILKIELARRNI